MTQHYSSKRSNLHMHNQLVLSTEQTIELSTILYGTLFFPCLDVRSSSHFLFRTFSPTLLVPAIWTTAGSQHRGAAEWLIDWRGGAIIRSHWKVPRLWYGNLAVTRLELFGSESCKNWLARIDYIPRTRSSADSDVLSRVTSRRLV